MPTNGAIVPVVVLDGAASKFLARLWLTSNSVEALHETKKDRTTFEIYDENIV